MIKTLSQALRMDKERFKVPRSVQQAIPIQRIWPDGIFQQGTKFSKTFRFTDINYYIASKDNKCRRGSQEEAEMIAAHIHSLICSTYGHTLVLFTSYHLMGNVYQMLRDEIPFPMIEVWRHSPEEITRFKQTDNAVLFAAGSCWEGVDFPGDMVSSLIIVKLPFAVPDPISEAQKKEYDCLKDYIQAVVVPDMQKKLRQGFGRALRTETDTCVVSILDERAGEDGRYHEEVMCALPKCKMAKDIKDVQRFIRNRKGVEYYL